MGVNPTFPGLHTVSLPQGPSSFPDPDPEAEIPLPEIPPIPSPGIYWSTPCGRQLLSPGELSNIPQQVPPLQVIGSSRAFSQLLEGDLTLADALSGSIIQASPLPSLSLLLALTPSSSQASF